MKKSVRFSSVRETNLFQIFLQRLETTTLRYMVTGATAAIVYSEPRLTHDIDLVIEMLEKDSRQIEQIFPADQFYCPPIEVLEHEARRPLRGHFK